MSKKPNDYPKTRYRCILKQMLAITLVITMFTTFAPEGMYHVFNTQTTVYAEDSTLSASDDAILFNGHSYKVYEQGYTWIEAAEKCEEIGGHLVTIKTPEEQQFIQSLISGMTKNQYWLGAYRENTYFKWVDGTVVEYANWDPGQPDNYRGQENYVQIYRIPNPVSKASMSYHWNDVSIDNYVNEQERAYFSLSCIGYICEWDYEVPTQTDTTILMDAEQQISINKDLPVSAELNSSSFVPTSTNMSWHLEYNNGAESDDISIGDLSIVNAGENSYIISSIFNFNKAGDYEVTLKSDDGASATILITVKNGSTLEIIKPESNEIYASQLNKSKTFSVTLDQADEKPQADDFEYEIIHKDKYSSTSGTAVPSEAIELKNVKEESDGKYTLEFEFIPNNAGFFDFNIRYKDGDDDDVGLMIYDTEILEKLEKDFDGTVKSTFDSYMGKIKREVEKIGNDSEQSIDYQMIAKDLQKDSSLIINGALDTGSLVNFNNLSPTKKAELTACAYEAYARGMKNVAKELHFEKIDDNDKVDQNIVNTIIKYLENGKAENKTWIKLDSGYTENGSLHSVSARWNLNFNNGRIDIRDDSTNKQYAFSVTSKEIYKCVANYLEALSDLEISAIENVKKQCLDDIQKLINWDFISEGKEVLDHANRNWANTMADWLSAHKIDHLIDNIRTYWTYYVNAKKVLNAIKTGATVIVDDSMPLNDQIASLYDIYHLELNSPDCGDYAKKIYEKIVVAEKKGKEYLEEYLTTGTIKDLDPVTLEDILKSGFVKNVVKCPVNVSVIDESGILVGYVGDDDIWYDDDIIIEEYGDTKTIYTPLGQYYSFAVTGTDAGTVSYTAEQFVEGTSIGYRVNAYDIPIIKDTVINILNPSGNVLSTEDVSITSQGNAIETVLVNNTSSIVDISLNNDNSCGSVSGEGKYVIGDIVTLKATPEEGYIFDGWYEEDLFVDWSMEYQFEARGNKTLTAKYYKKMTEEEIDAIAENVLMEVKPSESHTHIWNSGTITIQPTTSTTGMKTFTCLYPKCEQTRTETLSYHLYGYQGVINDNYELKYYIEMSDELQNNNDLIMRFTIGDSIYETPCMQKNGNYQVFSCKMGAAQISDLITAELLFDGEAHPVSIYSLREYLETLILNPDQKEEYTEVKELAEALLTYSAYAQTYFGYNTANLSNQNLENDPVIILSDNDVIDSILLNVDNELQTADFDYYGASLICNSDTSLRIYFTNVNNMTLDQIKKSYEIQIAGINNKVYESGIKGDLFYITVKDISAMELDNRISVRLISTDSSSYVTYSPIIYIREVLRKDSASQELKNLCKALWLYNLAADKYNQQYFEHA